MRVVITGSSGYIGKNLFNRLQTEGFDCISVKREFWDGRVERISELLAGTDVVINLAGAPILKRWNKKNKDEIYKSRVSLTQKLVSAIHLLPETKRPGIFITASAIGIYNNGVSHDETSKRFDNGYLGKLVQDWELASSTLPDNVKRIVFRIGLVLGKESKTVTSMVPIFKFGLGGKIASGKQPFPFIHIDDLVAAFVWAIKNKEATGVFNMVAPHSITNKQFTNQLAKRLKRPALFTVPAFILKMLLGNAAQLLIQSPEIIPKKLIEKGFVFGRPTIEDALNDIN